MWPVNCFLKLDENVKYGIQQRHCTSDHLWLHILRLDFFMWALRCWCLQRERREGWLFHLLTAGVCDGILRGERRQEKLGLEKSFKASATSESSISRSWYLIQNMMLSTYIINTAVNCNPGASSAMLHFTLHSPVWMHVNGRVNCPMKSFLDALS